MFFAFAFAEELLPPFAKLNKARFIGDKHFHGVAVFFMENMTD